MSAVVTEAAYSIRDDEIKDSWGISDSILAGWKQPDFPLNTCRIVRTVTVDEPQRRTQ